MLCHVRCFRVLHRSHDAALQMTLAYKRRWQLCLCCMRCGRTSTIASPSPAPAAAGRLASPCWLASCPLPVTVPCRCESWAMFLRSLHAVSAGSQATRTAVVCMLLLSCATERKPSGRAATSPCRIMVTLVTVPANDIVGKTSLLRTQVLGLWHLLTCAAPTAAGCPRGCG